MYVRESSSVIFTFLLTGRKVFFLHFSSSLAMIVFQYMWWPDHSITHDNPTSDPPDPIKSPHPLCFICIPFSGDVSSRKHEKGVTLRLTGGGEWSYGLPISRNQQPLPLKLMNSCPRRKRNNPLFQQFALPYNLYWVSFLVVLAGCWTSFFSFN